MKTDAVYKRKDTNIYVVVFGQALEAFTKGAMVIYGTNGSLETMRAETFANLFELSTEEEMIANMRPTSQSKGMPRTAARYQFRDTYNYRSGSYATLSEASQLARIYGRKMNRDVYVYRGKTIVTVISNGVEKCISNISQT